MPPITIHVDPDYGSDAESGFSPKRAKKTIYGALAANPKPGWHIALRMGSIHYGEAASQHQAYTLKTNGVTLTSYATGSEPNTPPILVYPRAAQLAAGYKSVILGILGKENIIRGLDFWTADIHQQVYQTNDGNTFEGCRSFDFGFGIVDKASYTTINDCYFYRGHMVRDGGDDAAGASAVVLERYKDYPHVGTRINRIFAELCMAPSIRYRPHDGSIIELSGGIEDAIIANCIGVDVKILVEVGGYTALKQTIRDVLFKHNLVVNSQKGLAYFNNPTEQFYADMENMRFVSNTVIMDENSSALYFAGDHKNLSEKVYLEKNVIVGAGDAPMIGTSRTGGTDLRTLRRANNVYSSDPGIPLINGDSVADPQFANPLHGDYRLSRRADHDSGALIQVVTSVSRIPDQSGVIHSVPSWADMNALPSQKRGRCRIPRYRLEYEWNPIAAKWLKVGSYTPPAPR